MKQKDNKPMEMPLWRGVLQHLIETAGHGDEITVGWFEDQLKCVRGSKDFWSAMISIRKGVEAGGMFISGRGLKGLKFRILMADGNLHISKLRQSQAGRLFSKTLTLLGATPTEGLSESQLRTHEKLLSLSAFRLAMMRKRTHELPGPPPAPLLPPPEPEPPPASEPPAAE